MEDHFEERGHRAPRELHVLSKPILDQLQSECKLILKEITPTGNEVKLLKAIFDELKTIILENKQTCKAIEDLNLYGSSSNGLYLRESSDLDLSVIASD